MLTRGETMKSRKKAAPRIVVIGGGTGLSTMLRGLKLYSENITAIVTMSDDGGGSGMLREELGMPPPGDVRNCIQALANTEPIMEELLSYRFTDGSLKGQSFGNLFLAALNGMSDTFDQAVRRMSEVLAITGRVLPVTNELVYLAADFDDGSQVLGESRIADFKKGTDKKIERVRLIPEQPKALPGAIEAINQAEMIVLGPGSLYTSIMPNLITDGVASAVAQSDAFRIYVLNVMTQDGETEGYTASDHIRALFSNSGEHLFDWCLANSTDIPEELAAKYRTEGAEQVAIDEQAINDLGVGLLRAPLAVWDSGYVRHNPRELARQLLRAYTDKSGTRIYK